jgi:hypothetical protein
MKHLCDSYINPVTIQYILDTANKWSNDYNAKLWASGNTGITIHDILANMNLSWNWYRVTCRHDVTIDVLEQYPTAPWDTYALSRITQITYQEVRQYPLQILNDMCDRIFGCSIQDIVWCNNHANDINAITEDNHYLTSGIASLDDILICPNAKWNWRVIFNRDDLDIDALRPLFIKHWKDVSASILAFFERDIPYELYAKYITIDVIKQHPQMDYQYRIICMSKYITFYDIVANSHINWNWNWKYVQERHDVPDYAKTLSMQQFIDYVTKYKDTNAYVRNLLKMTNCKFVDEELANEEIVA